jgi:membrane-bound lytic murein transglycosylase B
MKKIGIITFVIMASFFKALPNSNPLEFEDWVNKELRPLAIKKGISEQTLSRAFKDVKQVPQLALESTDKPPLKEKRIPPRIITARHKAKQHRRLLGIIEGQYGVPQEVILAVWGLESNFGAQTGQFITVYALSKLAFEGHRREFFMNELIEALKIIQTQKMDPRQLKGSLTGGLGQCQFMPSTFNAFAVDATGKGCKDIWNSTDDVFSSIANYLASAGWKANEPWGIEVVLPADFDSSNATLKTQHPTEHWKRLGVKPREGQGLPDLKGSLIILNGKAFLVYNNFRVILKWNNSQRFALRICQFADQIRSYDNEHI